MYDLVRVRIGNIETNVSPAHAELGGWEVLKDEPTTNGDGTLRPETRRNSRPVKPKTSVAKASAGKKTRGGQSTPDAEEAPA